ncbi:MAG: hypothetical protein FWH52_03265 [Synergistaceae bacterium]|nr:hypothetical protein [Synergistaceae bacterium]
MRIKWKFEDNGPKSYYKNSEPWKKQSPKQSILYQILKIILAIVACGIIIIVAFSYQGYDWNQSGFRYIRDIVAARLGIFR